MNKIISLASASDEVAWRSGGRFVVRGQFAPEHLEALAKFLMRRAYRRRCEAACTIQDLNARKAS